VSHIWSPDDSQVAFILREGGPYDEPAEAKGIWLLDTATLETVQIMEEASTESYLVGWTPDASHLIGYHREAEGASYYYAVRPDGGDRRILPVKPEATLLGWMPYLGQQAVADIELDTWRMRFLDAGDSANAVADTVADYVAASGSTDSAELSQRVTDYLVQAGWETGLAGPQVTYISGDLYIAQLPPFAIYTLQSGRASKVADGHLVLDARQKDGDLGVIFGLIGANSVQPAFALLRQDDAGNWFPIWTAMGQRDWIATDGEIRFAGEGLDRIEVAGSSFGLDIADDLVFSECHACPHRRLKATWVRQGDGYVRETTLAADAAQAEIYWEMTVRTPYAILYEVLRRLRQGLPAEELVSQPSVISKLEDYGLIDTDLKLAAEAELANGVRFTDLGAEKRYTALTKDGKLLHVEPVKD